MIEKLYSFLELNLDSSRFAGLFDGELSTTTLVLLSLIPLCVALFVREVLCWFYKVNGLLRRINRLEAHLRRIGDLLEQNIAKQAPTVPPQRIVSGPDIPKVDIELKRRDF